MFTITFTSYLRFILNIANKSKGILPAVRCGKVDLTDCRLYRVRAKLSFSKKVRGYSYIIIIIYIIYIDTYTAPYLTILPNRPKPAFLKGCSR